MKLKLVVPVGGHPEMYAWGVRCLKFSVETAHPNVDLQILDLRDSPESVDLWYAARRSLEPAIGRRMRRLYRSLGLDEPLEVRPSERFFHYLSLFLHLTVSDPAALADDKALASLLRTHGSAARDFVARFDALLARALGTCGAGDVIGVSVYQLLLGHSLFIAHRLRQLYPSATLILGGDPFDMATAVEVVRTQRWVDAVCLGPGEQAILDLIEVVRSGRRATDADVPRLVNQYFLSDIEHGKQKWDAAFKGRSDYAAIQGYHGVEWNPSVQRIQVLGRRGCAWAVCTFCARMHVITKEYVFDPSMNLMRQEIHRLLRSFFSGALPETQHSNRSFYTGLQAYLPKPPKHTLSISIDADDVDVFAFVDLLRWLKHEIAPGQQVTVSSYAPVLQLSRPEVHSLGELLADAPGLKVSLAVPIESLNPQTTVTMKKGTNPIDNIKALKVALDAGCQARGMYFSFYPRERLEDVAAESDYLRRAFHLVGAGTYNAFIYVGSRRDAIGQRPEDYGIDLQPRVDPLMKRMGLDLDASYGVRYTVRGDTGLSRMQQLYVDLVHDWVEFMYMGTVRRLARALVRAAACSANMLRLRNAAYMRRAYWLFRMQFARGRTRAKLYLGEDECVHRVGVFQERRFRLTRDELAVLRFLYQRRRLSEVTAAFSHVPDLSAILERFDRRGWTAQYNQMVISVVNDPVGLRLLADETTLDRLTRHYADIDDGHTGRIVPGRREFTLVTGSPDARA